MIDNTLFGVANLFQVRYAAANPGFCVQFALRPSRYVHQWTGLDVDDVPERGPSPLPYVSLRRLEEIAREPAPVFAFAAAAGAAARVRRPQRSEDGGAQRRPFPPATNRGGKVNTGQLSMDFVLPNQSFFLKGLS